MYQEKNIKIMEPSGPKLREIHKYLKTIDKNGIYTNFGPLHDQLIFEFSKYFKINQNKIVLLSNATLALIGAIATTPNMYKVWQVPSWTFTATPSAIVAAGRSPRFVDVDKQWRAKFSSKNHNWVDVLPFGDEMRISYDKKPNDFLIIDGAASFDALKNINFGNLSSTAIILSLHATKLMSAGEGGVFITNDELWAKRLRSWSSFGFDSKNRVSSSLGINAKFSEYNAAVGLASFYKWEINRNKIRHLTERVNEISNKYSFDVAPAMRKGLATPYWIVHLKTKAEKVRLVKQFQLLGIETRDWWAAGCKQMPAFNRFTTESLVNTKKLSETTIGLPFHLKLTNADLNRIDNAISFTD